MFFIYPKRRLQYIIYTIKYYISINIVMKWICIACLQMHKLTSPDKNIIQGCRFDPRRRFLDFCSIPK